MDLLKSGINVLMDRELLTVTTIKKKFVDQMPELGYGEFCKAVVHGRDTTDALGFVGRVRDALVVIKVGGNFKKVTARDWVEWRTNQIFFDAPGADTQLAEQRKRIGADSQQQARAEWEALPQLFED
jgi:hypothetical protein